MCLVEFRARLVNADMTGFLKDRMLAVAKRSGAIGHRRVVDSTGIADSVVTQDTVTLIRTAVRLCVDRLAVVDPAAAGRLAAGLRRSDYAAAGKPQILWSSPTARAELIKELFADATMIIHACAGIDDAMLAQHVDLLRIVAAQDVEDDGDGGPGRHHSRRQHRPVVRTLATSRVCHLRCPTRAQRTHDRQRVPVVGR